MGDPRRQRRVTGPCPHGVARALAAFIIMAPALAGCATAPSPPGGPPGAIDTAISQPFHDIGLVNRPVPATLAGALAAPYEPPARDCTALRAEIAALDRQLGEDVDRPVVGGLNATTLLAGALGGVIGLPYRGVIREVTGAARRDRTMARAVLAGVARRGFLKGLALSWDCPPAEPAVSPAPG